ncbi:hypothetical protein DN30_3639 [Vibrio cholerae]|nr:hypothetical protein DN30_3639 [Vibrio cholerae]
MNVHYSAIPQPVGDTASSRKGITWLITHQ